MHYTGQFKTILKDKLYQVDIITKGAGGGEPTELILGPDAFTTSMSADNNTIYCPVKYQSASVQIVANEYYFDMYASTPKENSVTLKDTSTNAVLWTGWISPNVWDAPYNFVTETWTVECVDGLSVLKNYDYTPVGETRHFASFAQIIDKCLTTAGCYSGGYWYMSKATKIPNQNSLPLVDNLYISEQNFFDEDDVPMKLNTVLEEICKFLGVTAVADGKNVYFIDYDAVRAGVNTYDRYTIGSSSVSRNVSVSNSLTITKDSYSSTGSTLSLDTVYSKVTVKDSLYAVKSIIPSMFNDEDLRNVHYQSEDDQQWNFELPLKCFHQGDSKKKTEDDTYFQIKARYYTNKRYIHNFFDNDTGNCTFSWDESKSSSSIPIQSPLTAANSMGGLFTKYIVGTGNTLNESYANTEYDSWENYLMLTANHSDATGRTPGGSGDRGMALIQSNNDFSKPFFMSGRTKLVAKGELIITDRITFPNQPEPHYDVSIGYWPHTGTFVSEYNGNWWRGDTLMVEQGILTLKTKIDIGSTSKTFDIPFYPIGRQEDELNENKKKHEIFYTSFGVQDSVEYYDKITEKGYLLNMGLSQDSVILAKPKISLYGMENFRLAFYGAGVPSPVACVFIKDFDIVAEDPHEGPDDNINATDTEYSVEINSDYVTELSPIEFKICTSDGKSLNYSSVVWKNGSSYKFVDTLNNSALGSAMAASDGGESTRRAEEIMCFRLVNQYSSPSKKLSIHLFDDLVKPYSLITDPAESEFGDKLLNCDFIVNTMEHNYATDTVVCELVEKK